MPALSPVAALLCSAVSLSSQTVPASGRASALVTLDKPAMVRLSATSAAGTECEVVDRVRGPFARSGKTGHTSCAVDLLLDQGAYKLRLESPKRGKGVVRLEATEFVEQNPTPQRLVPKTLQRFGLKSGQQASFWLSMPQRGAPYLRVSGRTAGDVRLWRNGEWVEANALRHENFSPEPGRPVHEWWGLETLEAGDYLVRIYGTAEHAWPGGNEHDDVEVELGVRDGSPTRTTAFTLGRSGLLVLRTSPGDWGALLQLDVTPNAPVELSVDGLPFGGPTCRIEKKALIPQCLAFTGGPVMPHVLVVRGPAGTKGFVGWVPRWSDGWYGGYWGSANTNIAFRSPGGLNVVGLHDLPLDLDAAPLGCMLVANEHRLAWDFPVIGDGRSLDAKFNYDGRGQLIWFDVKRGGRYRIETKGDRKSRCELYRFGTAKATLDRLSSTQPNATSCAMTVNLSEGSHQLSLFDGAAGIERLVVAEEGRSELRPLPPKAGCLLPTVALTSGSHTVQTNRTGNVSTRGVVVEQLPLKLDNPLHLTLDPGRKVSLPLARATAAIAQTSAGTTLTVGPEKLELDNPTDTPLQVTVFTPQALPPPPGLEGYAPNPVPLPMARADAPVFLDFEREQSHSMVFEVDTPGLYNVSTQGLLATSCTLRTPVIPEVAVDTSGGRGRNCLVAGYLRPGRYLLTAKTVGHSRGRASVLLTKRPVRDAAVVASDGDAFFRAAAGDLIQQKLVIPESGNYELATTAQGAGGALGCRLDDAEGWPLTAVPTSCSAPRTLAKGTYLWTQLPLTVESMRHTHLQRVLPPPVLTGNKAHPIDFFTWYRARLGPDGRDELTFTLEGPAELDVVLTNGMQGRIFLLQPGKPPKAVELVPPTNGTDAPEVPDEPPAVEADPIEPEPEYEECEDCEPAPPQETPSVQPIAASDAPPPPGGARVRLAAGSYKLVTEHSRGDVAIDYQLHLGSAVLMPGMKRSLPTPARLPVAVPRDGVLRVRTRGEADVRCRLFDRDGRLVLEGSENGPDWNCSIAEPVKRGDYTLVLESETQSKSRSTLSLELAPVEDRGQAADGMKLVLSTAVHAMTVPAGDAVQSLKLTSKGWFSCALEDAAGAVLSRQSRVKACALSVHPRNDRYRVRVWTTEPSATVVLSLASVAPVRVGVPSPGTWRTAARAQCISAARTGLLRPCGPEASLEAGEVVFSEPVTLEEVTLREPRSWSATLSSLPWIQAVDATASVVLLETHVQHGERSAPACSFGAGGVHDARAYDCYAASAVGGKAIARAWSPGGEEVAGLRVRPVAVPASHVALKPGRQRLEWSGAAAAFDLPLAQPSRVALLLAPGAWAVQLDAAGRAVDHCAPNGALAACAFSGRGGFVLVTGDAERALEADLELLDAAEKAVAFDGLYEAAPRQRGQLKLDVPARPEARTLSVEGDARCVMTLSDGVRLTGCRVEVPAGASAELRVDHGAGPLRVLAFADGREQQARFGVEPLALAPAPLGASTSVALAQGLADRTLVIDRDSVVRVSSAAGVCALYRGSDLLAVDGLEAGCEIVRVLSRGTYRAVVRPFAGQVQAGTFRWTSEPLVALREGVGTEDWLAPAESRLYRFSTRSKGRVGFGVQAPDEAIDCAVYDAAYRLLGEGCQQYLQLEKGSYLLSVKRPATAGAPLRFKPVLLGLAGAKAEVPREYLDDFFRRNGGAQ